MRKRNRVKRHRVKVGRESEKSFLVIRFMLLAGVVVCGSLFYVYQHTQLVHTGYQIRKNEKVLEKLVKENSRLEMKISKIKSPIHLERLVVTYKLNLIKPKEEQVVRLPRIDKNKKLSSAKMVPWARVR